MDTCSGRTGTGGHSWHMYLAASIHRACIEGGHELFQLMLHLLLLMLHLLLHTGDLLPWMLQSGDLLQLMLQRGELVL